MSLTDRLRALLGVAAFPQPAYGPEHDDAVVERIRGAIGGQIQPLPTTKIRWYLSDLEVAQHAADAGDMSRAAQLHRAMKRDGVLSGLLGTRTSGLVRLPKTFTGDPEISRVLEGRDGARSVFDDMFPPSELALLAADGIVLGVGLSELVDVEGRDYPVMIRLDPEWLRYRWVENRWYFSSMAGLLPITPGDGRWILHTPGGRLQPWLGGQWPALGRAWINKEHAMLHRSNYESKLANPARALVAPLGATEPERQGMFARLIAWGINTVFELPVGWDVKLIESNGRGFEVFQSTIATSDLEFMIVLAGQVVTTTGGTGFANADIHKSIRADLIQQTGDELGYTLNTQGIPPYVLARWGEGALDVSTCVEWSTKPPKDLEMEAKSMQTFGTAVATLSLVAKAYGRELDMDELFTRFGVPIKLDAGTGEPAPPSDIDIDLLAQAKTTGGGAGKGAGAGGDVITSGPVDMKATRRRLTRGEYDGILETRLSA